MYNVTLAGGCTQLASSDSCLIRDSKELCLLDQTLSGDTLSRPGQVPRIHKGRKVWQPRISLFSDVQSDCYKLMSCIATLYCIFLEDR